MKQNKKIPVEKIAVAQLPSVIAQSKLVKQQKNLSWIFFTLITLFLIPLISANLLYCLSDGQKLPPNCQGTSCKYTCDLSSGQGFCQICTTNLGTPGVDPLSCGDKTCSFLDGGNGGGAPDPNPPVLTINTPTNGETFDSTRVIFDLTVDSASRIEYKDAADTSWHKLCDGCTNYNRHVSVEEGQNQITIRATKFSNNMQTEKIVTFSVDSKVPVCKSSTPINNEYSNGEFTVEYSEANLDKVELYYMGTQDANYKKVLVACPSGQNQICAANINLDSYKNSQVSYYFNICDKASCDSCKTQTAKVTSNAPPVLTVASIPNLNTDKKILLDILTDKLSLVYYIDNSDPEKPKTLCKNCNAYSKIKSFNDGNWDITFYAEDENQQHAVPFNAKFFIDTKIPIIQKTYPKKNEFADGIFIVEFKEENPQTLILHYGDDESSVNLAQCTESKKKYTCEADVSAQIEKYDGEVISYWFELTDEVGNEAKYKTTLITVDTTEPKINSINYVIDGTSAELAIDITEANLESITYENSASSKPKETKLCTKLKDGICTKKIKLVEGSNTIDIRVYDKVGNEVAEQVQITI